MKDILVKNERIKNLISEEHHKCIGCRLCTRGCPMLDEFSDNPKKLLSRLELDNSFEIELPYACMLCGYCEEVCPKEVSFRNLFYEFRKVTVDNYNGKLPRGLNTRGVDLHQKLSFSKLFSDNISGKHSGTIFFPGCSLLSNNPEMVAKVYDYLYDRLDGIGYSNHCCGKPTDFLGKHSRFKELLEKLKFEFDSKGVKKIITGCQNCYMSFKRNAPEYEVVSVYEILDEVGLPCSSIGRYKDEDFTVIHDPCPTRGEDKVHEAVRNIVNSLGIKFEELKYNKRKTLCCGMGGMVALTSPTISKKHKDRRVLEAGDKRVITYCMECKEYLSKNDSTVHILDLIFSKPEEMTKNNIPLLKSWYNRYRARKLIGE